eukprot:6183150-Pleurochrysis_carterae.AAC.2
MTRDTILVACSSVSGRPRTSGAFGPDRRTALRSNHGLHPNLNPIPSLKAHPAFYCSLKSRHARNPTCLPSLRLDLLTLRSLRSSLKSLCTPPS